MTLQNKKTRQGSCTKKSNKTGIPPEKTKKQPHYPPELRLKAVMLHIQDGHTRAEVSRQLGIPYQSIKDWVVKYRRHGETVSLFRSTSTPDGGGVERSRLPTPVRDKIVELKQANSRWGVRRIAQVLRRWFLLEASAETVRRTLHKEQLMDTVIRRPKRNPGKPRFFERATPNQMWQTDIFCFRLGGTNAYLIAFLDDYSRFIVGLELFRSQTAQSVLEVYRRAVGEYGTPKEMLTDNGRQYATWRGKTRFQMELAKDRIAHIRSRPHHPMTLGKVERFWNSIWGEFLGRAQFDDFEQARARIRLWVQYYNHKRPHQGLGGLCPADRFFEIQHDLRKTIEAGIRENALEMALRGKPNAPFYMVGRMHGQSVVLRAEKGKLKLHVDGDDTNSNQELEYDIENEKQSGQPGSEHQEELRSQQNRGQDNALPAHLQDIQLRAESPGGAGGVDRTPQPDGNLPPAPDQLCDIPEMAEPGHGGHASSAGQPTPDQRHGGAQPAPSQAHGSWTWSPGGPPWTQADQNSTRTGQQPPDLIMQPCDQEIQRPSTAAGPDHPASPLGPDHRDRGGNPVGNLPQNLLSVGTPGPRGDARGLGEWQSGTPAQTQNGPGNPPLEKTGGATGEPPPDDGRNPGTPWHARPSPPASATGETETETPACGT